MNPILNWDGIEDGDHAYTLREVVENMRQDGAIVEMIGVLYSVEGRSADYNQDVAEKLLADAGHLVTALGDRAIRLLDAQTKAPAQKPRLAKRRAA